MYHDCNIRKRRKIHDCQCGAAYGENQQGQRVIDHGHMNFAQAGELAANAQAYFPNAECGFDSKMIALQFEK